MKNTVIANPSQYVVITTIVYALLSPIFFEMYDALEEREKFVVINDDKTMTYSQQEKEVETECKSPCPKSAQICIAMCA